jgi:hypothetical protein
MNDLDHNRRAGSFVAETGLVVLFVLLFTVAAVAQTTPETLSGTVVDGATRQPVFRALVRLTGGSSQRAVLTDSSGHFIFPEVDSSQITLTAVKPGYTFTRNVNDPNQLHIQPADAANPVQLVLYPKALLKGTITDPNGNPLANISVQALRGTDDDAGHHWVPLGLTRSDTHGQFRLQVPAGDYRLQTDISRIPGTSAILPTIVPDSSDPAIQLDPGDQRDVDLHPPIAPLLNLSARLNISVDEMNLLTAILPDGTSFPVPFTKTGASTLDTKLPGGTYILQARRHNFGADGLDQASLTLVPSARQPISVALQFVPVASIPIEVVLDDDAVAAAVAKGQTLTAPNARGLGLALEPTTPQPSVDAEYLRTAYRRDDPGVTFTAPPGTYRFRAQRNYVWFITSALYGGTDLLAHDLTIAAGSGSTPIVVTLSNQMASLTGTVTLNGAPAACWIYLVATTPSATPVLTLRSSDNGTFTQSVPPGSYRAVAFPNRHSPDPESLTRNNPTTITATAGNQTAITLEATPDSEFKP